MKIEDFPLAWISHIKPPALLHFVEHHEVLLIPMEHTGGVDIRQIIGGASVGARLHTQFPRRLGDAEQRHALLGGEAIV